MSEYNPYVQNKIRVLIISDRLMDRAIELSNYLCSAGVHIVGLVKNKEQALEMVDQVIDFLIIALVVFIAYKQLSRFKLVDEKTIAQKNNL